MPIAQSAPSEFVADLIDPGLWIVPLSKWVSLKQYLCAVGEYGGNAKATQLMLAIQKIVKGTSDEATIKNIGTIDFSRMFTGQGKPEHISQIMHLIWYNKERFADYKDGSGKQIFAKYFQQANPIQAMVDEKMFGLDCIGFVGRYLEDSGIFTSYQPLYPRHYLDRFLPIKSISDVEDLCILVWVKGTHIAIIDSVKEVHDKYVVVDICQSSSGGPQMNTSVRLTLTAAEFIDFGAYGKAVDGKNVTEDEKAALRKKYTSRGSVGYRGGIFFKVSLGRPLAPVVGDVYIGKLPGMTKAWQTIELD